MANILTAAEAANLLRTVQTDPDMLALLPLVDAYLKNATGRDWAGDSSIRPEAKSAARMLLVMWHENPSMIGQGITSLTHGLSAALLQLEALALELETSGVPGEDLELTACFPSDGSIDVAITANMVLIFNHEMASGATASVSLKDAAGAVVAGTNSLDATTKILTVNPTASLISEAYYTLVITHAADVYGMTLETEIRFRTA